MALTLLMLLAVVFSDCSLVKCALDEVTGIHQKQTIQSGNDLWKRSGVIKDYITADRTPSFKSVFQETTVRPGSYLSLLCVATGYPVPHISWKLDGLWTVATRQDLRINSYLSTRRDVYSYANFSAVGVQDGGLYSCTASNTVGSVSHSARLNVVGNIFVRITKNLTAVAGGNFYVHCPFGGYPYGTITWERDGRTLPANQRQQVFTNGTLAIAEIDPQQDDGKYTCRVGGLEGQSVSGSFFILIKVRPTVASFAFQNNLQQGMRTAVTCVVLGGDPPIRLWWQKEGSHLNENELDATVIVSEDGFVSTLTIKNLSVRHNGNYTCLAQNEIGTETKSAILRVKVPPRWVLEPKDTSSVVGNTVVIDCQAEGVPEPHVRWKVASEAVSSRKNYKTLISSSRIQILVNGSLNVRGIEKGDAGNYLCEANNGVGSGLSTVIKLSVHSVPQTPVKYMSVNSVKGHQVVLNCSARGDPPIRFTWSKEGEHFSPGIEPRYRLNDKLINDLSLSALSIDGTERRDSGNFVCQARNDFGEDTMKIQLKVQEKPDAPRNLEVKEIGSRNVVLAWAESYSGNLPILRYTVLWRLADSNWVRNIPPTIVPGSDTTVTVGDLKPIQQYVFHVKAENALGSSDFSSDITVTTLDEHPPQASLIKIISVSTSSVHISWKTETKSFSPVSGYKIFYQMEGGAWKELHTTNTTNGYVVRDLKCGTKYGFYLVAYNKAGRSDPSKVVYATTNGKPPVAPDKSDLLTVNSTFVIIHLLAWKSGGCPISYFMVQYKHLEHNDWILLSNNIIPEQNQVYIYDLSPGTWYALLMTAHNDAGAVDFEYIFGTLTLTGESPSSPFEKSDVNSLLQRHFTITIPIASSVIVLVVVFFVVCTVTRRRNSPRRLTSPEGADACEHTKAESMPLSVTSDHQHVEPAYLPSPYGIGRASVHRSDTCGRLKPEDGNLRTFGRMHSDHVYDVPFPVKRAEMTKSYPQYSRSPVSIERDYSFKKPSHKKSGRRIRTRPWREDGDGSSGNDSDGEYQSEGLMMIHKIAKEGSETECDRQWKLRKSDVSIQGRSIVV